MKKTRTMRIFILGCALSLPFGLWAQGDPDAGKAKAYTCTGCHGIPGYNNVYPTYRVPKIGGQHESYLIAALQAYRSGERRHPTMVAQATSMSEQDIEDIAAYLSQRTGR